MGLWDRVASMIALAPWDHPPVELSAPPIEEQVARATRQASPRPWRVPSVREALGVPAIFGAATLIANVSATLSLRGLRDGVEMAPDDRPRTIVRPNPYSTMRDFVRETVWPMATLGEAWLWTPTFDDDGFATSIVPVNPREVAVEPGRERGWLEPVVTWRGRAMRPGTMHQVVHTRDTGELRGYGPLQACGAAVSVSVEAQEWAANYFADGGNPSIHIHHEDDLSPKEAGDLREQWVQTPPNMPQVTSGPVSVEEIGKDVPGAQMLEARNWNVGDVARMFHVPGSLVEFAREGASLTYQNVTQEFDKLLKTCLLPDYIEPIEQVLSDLLPDGVTARFNQEELLRADVKTRYEVYTSGIGSGVLTVEEARAKEGLSRGDIENAPVPASPATVPPIPLSRPLRDVVCARCSHKVGEVEFGRGRQWCRWCKDHVPYDVAA